MNLTPDDLIEALQVVQGWRTRNMGIIDSMIDSEAEAVRIEGVGKPVRLEGDTLKGFKVGLIVAKELIGSLPFNLTEDEQEQNLNSDQLRRQLDENNESMNTLADDNQRIVELLAQRGLQAVDPAGDDISIHPCIMQLDKLQSEPKPLTADELKAGGWWCSDISGECAAAFESKSINTYNSEAWAWGTERLGWVGCLFNRGKVVRTTGIDGGEKQIHRIGNEFYWGAHEKT